MSYVPNTSAEQQAMLEAMGFSSIEDILTPVPANVRLNRSLDLPAALNEPDLRRVVSTLAKKNLNLNDAISFLGAGSYERYIPSVVTHLQSRSEFVTSYTPYQPEVSQGMLQAIYEFQTLVCQITGLDIANASLYDGSTAVVEAVLLALGPGGRGDIVVSQGLDPQYRTVLNTYAFSRGFNVIEVPLVNGITSPTAIAEAITPKTAAVLVQQPNFYGSIEDMQALDKVIHATKALFVSVITEPASLATLAAPGEYNADLAVGELMSFGNTMSFGGPALGFMASKQKYMRLLPGRLVGQTVEEGENGQTGYVLTLQTREQHIRRERATSNICTNQSLLAVGATIYMATIGKQGFADLGTLNVQKAHYAFRELTKLPGVKPAFDAPFFNEFALTFSTDVAVIQERLLEKKILAGYALPELPNSLLFCVTEMRTREEIDALVAALREVLA